MKFTIAPDSFKNSMSAFDVGNSIAHGIKTVFPDSQCKVIPMADGGEGTVNSIITAIGGSIIKVKANDPLMRPIDSFYGILPNKKTAIIEMAAASGIELILSEERNPMKTTSYGTGELILDALNKGCDSIIIGIGGSSTNDGGVGMAMALGYNFLNKEGIKLGYGGQVLSDIYSIDSQYVDKRLQDIKIKVACDVKNTLCGKYGASAVYGPQKGASQEMILNLDEGLQNLAEKIKALLDVDVLTLEGGGAAGGLGAGLVAFIGAELVGGFDLIANLVGLEEDIKTSDIVISAEGAIDFQTQYGKTPSGVASIAKKYNKPVFVFAGSVNDDAAKINPNLIDAIVPISRRPVNLNDAIKNTEKWLIQSAKELAIAIKTGINLT